MPWRRVCVCVCMCVRANRTHTHTLNELHSQQNGKQPPVLPCMADMETKRAAALVTMNGDNAPK